MIKIWFQLMETVPELITTDIVPHERVRVQNERHSPPAKLGDSEINAPFLLNEHGDHHFSMHDLIRRGFLKYISIWGKV